MIRAACSLALAGALTACQASLDLEDYAFGGSSEPSCSEGSVQCYGDAFQTCEGGAWSSPIACPDALPACNNGQCATARLRGGLSGVGGPLTPAPGTASGLRLRDARIDTLLRSCSSARPSLCVRGQLGP